MSTSAMQAISTATSTTTALATQPQTDPRMRKVLERIFLNAFDLRYTNGEELEPGRFQYRIGLSNYEELLEYADRHLFRQLSNFHFPQEGRIYYFLVTSFDLLVKEMKRLSDKYASCRTVFVTALSSVTALNYFIDDVYLTKLEENFKKTGDKLKETLKNGSKEGGLYTDLERFQQLLPQVNAILSKLECFHQWTEYLSVDCQVGVCVSNIFQKNALSFKGELQSVKKMLRPFESFYLDFRKFLTMNIDFLNTLIHYYHRLITLLDHYPELPSFFQHLADDGFTDEEEDLLTHLHLGFEKGRELAMQSDEESKCPAPLSPPKTTTTN